jgi:hypothetical protein
MEEGLAAEELEIIAGGMAKVTPGSKVAYCTDHTCCECRYPG